MWCDLKNNIYTYADDSTLYVLTKYPSDCLSIAELLQNHESATPNLSINGYLMTMDDSLKLWQLCRFFVLIAFVFGCCYFVFLFY